jgi:hypothetical protein
MHATALMHNDQHTFHATSVQSTVAFFILHVTRMKCCMPVCIALIACDVLVALMESYAFLVQSCTPWSSALLLARRLTGEPLNASLRQTITRPMMPILFV